MHCNHAVAGDGSCPWNHLPAETRERALAAGLNDGPAAMSSKISPAQFAGTEQTCGVNAANQDAFRRAESGYMLQILAEQWLAKYASLTPRQLDTAWTRMDDDAKHRIEQWTVALNHDPEAHDLAYKAFIAALGNPSNLPVDSRPKLLTYVQGRAFRAIFEPRF